MSQIIPKTVNLNLVGLDGNAFNLMGQFQCQARREGWTKEEIDEVLTECRTGDYNHLIVTLMDHCNVEEEEEI